MFDISALGAFLFGSVLGSFLNVVIVRYVESLATNPNQRGGFVLTGRSHCPACHGQLRWWELVPILSFVFLKGQCRRCRAKISIQYPLVEMTMGILVLIIATPLPETVSDIALVALSSLIAALLIVLFVIDLKTMLLPDIFVGLLLGVVIIKILSISNFEFRISNFSSALIGAGVGAGFLLFLWVVTRGQGIGLGDVKLMIPLGLWAGTAGTITLLFIAYTVGGLLAVYLLARKKAGLKTAMPFGPFLCGAALVILIWPEFPITFFTFVLGYNPFA